MPSAPQQVEVDGRRLRLTNLDKVMYPETGTTKGEVIAYYTRVAPLMLPLLADRPVTRKRWVEGVGTVDAPAEAFFAKQIERGAPTWVRHLPIEHSGGAKEYPIAADLPTLVWMAQIASIELHVPQWRFGQDGERRNPDRLVLDLDPGPGVDLAQCAHVARLAREILGDIGLDPVPVTSGSKGIHLYCHLDGTQSSDQASAIARELARSIETDHPDLATSTMSKSVRGGKVFIDWSQNNGSKTTISPYSLRGRAHPTAAAPRTWDELDDPKLHQLDFGEVASRVEEGIDPFAGFGPSSADAVLASYRSKRDASRTPEPVPERTVITGAGALPRFVIQEHHARAKHFDLRIERDGVLVSWAVPKGVPETPTRNRLAVMTEPHPLEYLTFHGEIPHGEYGAGTMTIWDSGTVELEKWRDDEVIGTFTGSGPLGRARLALIRTEGSGEKSSWLLHRMKAQDAAPKHAAPKQYAGHAPKRTSPQSTPMHSTTGVVSPMLAESGTPGLARSIRDAWTEIKWDGIRAIGTWQDGRLRLHARSGTDITARYPELTADGAPHFAANEAIVDGEIVALDASGRPSFGLLQRRMHLTKAREIEREVVRTPIAYHLFDLVRLDGHDLTGVPLRDRRALLQTLGESADRPVIVPPVFDDLDAAMQTSRELDLEGVVVKSAGSKYRPGIRSADWLKLKHTRTQEVAVAGIRPGKGNRSGTFGSLLLGVPDADGTLRYVGRVGSGFDDRMLRDLLAQLTPLRTDDNPLEGVPDLDARDALWVHPELVGEVEFAGWTTDRSLRHARWRGLRPDKEIADIRVE
ncbi:MULTISPECIES: ATP-dependent DNA ligase [unclassified Microbacterium]|uniref:ATP-dependent DNA ligase n=1 Tax=unclassified Microbacterium TaxID=2609290 RepID=UPI001D76C47B|nr:MULTISPECIES: ATP-dependent DNA ligase [unclassified Microbacterium]CAH0207807.1 Multifunctional non-homologous end joining protein LigD [Microbacterium sp. Bi121]HWK78926.1 ATP-dependent DNA ligase [Microbacterium sp.]